jgi:hypothetical protein
MLQTMTEQGAEIAKAADYCAEFREYQMYQTMSQSEWYVSTVTYGSNPNSEYKQF